MAYQRCLAPFAWSVFRQKNISEAIVRPGHVGTRIQLDSVNARVNRMPSRVGTPKAEEWLIWPLRAFCHDFAITKRHELLSAGWPSSSLLLAQCRIASGEAHMVLIVGDLVMDNRRAALIEKTSTGYDWSLPEQQSDDPNHWEQWR